MKKFLITIVALWALTACATWRTPVLLPASDVPAGVEQVATDLKDPETGDQLIVVQAADVPASVQEHAYELFSPPEQGALASDIPQVLKDVGGALGASGPWGTLLGTALAGLGAAYFHPKSRKLIHKAAKAPFSPFMAKPSPGGPAGSPSDAGPDTAV